LTQTPGIYDNARRNAIGASAGSRSDLLERVGRWTQRRKIKLCRGLYSGVVITSEVMLAHGLGQDEIDRWMDAYKRKDFEALKVGYSRKRTGL
jgi:uncharacterized protein DUF1153